MPSISATSKLTVKKTKKATNRTTAASLLTSASRPKTTKNGKNNSSTKKNPKKGNSKQQNHQRRGKAPLLTPKTLSTPSSLSAISSLPPASLTTHIDDLFRLTLGIPPPLFGDGDGGGVSPPTPAIATPRSKSTTADRSGHAADLAALTLELGVVRLLKEHALLSKIEAQLIPQGIGCIFGNEKGLNPGGGMRKITSCTSLSTMGGSAGSGSFLGTAGNGTSTVLSDSKRGRTTAPEAREGCLLYLRALAEVGGAASEPFLVPLLAVTLEECSSSVSMVREAAEDAAFSLLSLINPYAVSSMVCPVIFEALHSPEWRVKVSALDILAHAASLHPRIISRLLPKIIPAVTGQVWDTKPQVTKAAASALLACCHTNINPDVAPAVPTVVNAIMKPAETVKALDELKATTFVAPVDASTLSILCPVLSRGLKDKMALNKRSCCIVIENMSRLVETPEAVAPFGPLLVPDLKRVAENVQFDEIRDAALAALNALTKALGHASVDDALNVMMKEENERIEAEQSRIEEERRLEAEREEEMRVKEEEEKKQWREAMEAQRLLDKMALEEEEARKAEEKKKKDLAKKSVKGTSGKCQGCGLKKCKKTCPFAT